MASNRIVLIKEYFAQGENARPVTIDELKALSQDDRNELAELAAKELGKEVTT